MTRSYGRAQRYRGFSLLELVIAVAILAVLFVALGSVTTASSQGFTRLSNDTNAQAQARRLMDRLSFDLRIAHPDTVRVVTTTRDTTLTFQRVSGWDGDAPTLEAVTTVYYRDGAVTVDGVTVAEGLDSLAISHTDRFISITTSVTNGSDTTQLQTSLALR